MYPHQFSKKRPGRTLRNLGEKKKTRNLRIGIYSSPIRLPANVLPHDGGGGVTVTGVGRATNVHKPGVLENIMS